MLFAHLRKIAQNSPDHVGLRVGEQFIPYAQIAINVESLASGLLELGLGKGDRVAILLPNGPDFFTVTYAIAAIGAIAVPVNQLSGEAELGWLAQKCKFAAIICANQWGDVAKKLLAAGENSMPPIIQLNAVQDEVSVENLLKTKPIPLPKIAPECVASFLLSSGSTGRPKLVPHTHAQLIACAKVASKSLKLTSKDVILNALPAHHAFGFLNGCFEVMIGGASTFYWADPGPLMLSRKKFLALIKQQNISVMPGVPYIFQTLSQIREPVDLPSLRLIYSSGIALKREIYDAFQAKFNLTLHQGYGCTETGMLSLNGAGKVHSPWNSVGPPSSGVEVTLRPMSDQPEGVGEIFVKTEALIDGYVDADAEQNAAFVDGGYLTGDLGRFDELGNIYLVGRTKLIIEVAGEKVDPLEVEDVLCLYPNINEAVVVGVPDGATGEQMLKAYIVSDGLFDEDKIIAFCREKLLGFKVPEQIERIAEIPKSATGKVQRGKLM